ncbi:MAG: hypothetical protein H5U03_05820 [Clostridia bacterium]|nr:hypothetical protein [Clostridia bacterium]
MLYGRLERKMSEISERVERKISKIAEQVEKSGIAEYVELVKRPRRLIYVNFIAGLARGLGMAIGFTVLGALVIYLLSKLAILNLPVISRLIAEIIVLVREQGVIP